MIELDVSIIIPVYKRTGWLRECIERLLDQELEGSFEVVVVDDGSPDSSGFQNILNSFPSNAALRYIKNKHAGPAAARNFGVTNSTGKILCFIDDDSLPEKKWLKEIVKPFSGGETVGLVNGQTFSHYREAGLPLLLEKYVYKKKCWATCNIAYRRDVFKEIGGFDESFPDASWEDNDLGLRAKWAGYDHIYAEKACIYHPHERSLDEYRKKCLVNGRGAAVFSRKYVFKRPLWGIGTPFIMSRYLLYILHPFVWMKKEDSPTYLRFLWSYYSLLGYIESMGNRNGKD